MEQKKYAYIFDFDGVLVTTMEAHFRCYKQALAEIDVPIDKKQFYYQAGMKGTEQISYFAKKAGVTVNAEEIYARKRQIWNSKPQEIGRIECNLELLKMLRKAGHRTAIATGSSHESINPILKEFGIEVDAISASGDVKRGKPFPDLFLYAAKQLEAEPQFCIVIEDSEVGIEAAKAAGMMSMRFYNNVDS